MTSTIDTTILAMLSRYPDIPRAEADEYINQIEHEENIPLCHAVIGRIEPEELDDDARQTYNEFTRWSSDRTRSFRNEQTNARYRRKENRTGIRMAQLHQQGRISDEMMLLYGLSGDLPDRPSYISLNEEEKEALFSERMERRFGPNWRDRFDDLPRFLRRRTWIEDPQSHNWLKEGF